MIQLQNYSSILFRPLTDKMEELLMDIHEREILKLEPYEAAGTKFSKGLLDRGLLEMRDHTTTNGKNIFALYTTNLGRGYLSKL